MAKFGIGHVFPDCGGTVVGELCQLAFFIDQLRWSRFPEENRYSFPYKKGRRPAYYSGDNFWIDPVNWVVLAGTPVRDPEG